MKAAIALVLAVLSSTICVAQQATSTQKSVIFALLNSGATLEPIAYSDGDELTGALDGAQEADVLNAFHGRYFKPKTAYQLVFGGANAGTVTVKSSDPSLECERHTAKVIVASSPVKFRGSIMALAASSAIKAAGSGVRRAPSPAERSEIEELVREELVKNKVSPAVSRKLRSRNLTAIDVDGDDIVEFVGSYWVQPTPKSRSLLFFIAEKDSTEYRIVLSDFGTVKEEDTMGHDITAVDAGVGHELLLDVLDYDENGTAEIFTYEASFEGAGFNVYSRQGGKWKRVFETVNYRCAA